MENTMYKVVNVENKQVDNMYPTRARAEKRANALNRAYGLILFVVERA